MQNTQMETIGFMTVNEIFASLEKEIKVFAKHHKKKITPRRWVLEEADYRGAFLFADPNFKNKSLDRAFAQELNAKSLTPMGQVIGQVGIVKLIAYVNGEVYIDNELRGAIESGDVQEFDLAVGRPHKIVIKGDHGEIEKQVTVAKGKTKTVRFRSFPIKPTRAPTPQPTPVSTLENKKGFTNSLNMEFVHIKPGTFLMGSPDSEKGRENDETQHKVTLKNGFYMQTTEVTKGQWRAFINATGYKSEAETKGGAYVWENSNWVKKEGFYWDNPGFKQTDSHPVTCVSWNDAQKFIEWISQKEKQTYRLPTEAEWEYACRAGTKTPFAFGNCLSSDQANYAGNYPYADCPKGEYRQKTTPHDTFQPNDWGLYDMHGNVWEWCEDWYGDYPTGSVTDPKGASTGEGRVLRGGSWDFFARNCRSADRDRYDPSGRLSNVGFRLVRSLPFDF